MNDNGVELLGSYWTLAGDVEPVTGREWSLFDLRDRVSGSAVASDPQRRHAGHYCIVCTPLGESEGGTEGITESVSSREQA